MRRQQLATSKRNLQKKSPFPRKNKRCWKEEPNWRITCNRSNFTKSEMVMRLCLIIPRKRTLQRMTPMMKPRLQILGVVWGGIRTLLFNVPLLDSLQQERIKMKPRLKQRIKARRILRRPRLKPRIPTTKQKRTPRMKPRLQMLRLDVGGIRTMLFNVPLLDSSQHQRRIKMKPRLQQRIEKRRRLRMNLKRTQRTNPKRKRKKRSQSIFFVGLESS